LLFSFVCKWLFNNFLWSFYEFWRFWNCLCFLTSFFCQFFIESFISVIHHFFGHLWTNFWFKWVLFLMKFWRLLLFSIGIFLHSRRHFCFLICNFRIFTDSFSSFKILFMNFFIINQNGASSWNRVSSKLRSSHYFRN
jgi:hypothetical protein